VRAGADTPELLAASAWLSRMPEERARHEMLLQCTACHQLPQPKFRTYARFLDDKDEATRLVAWKAAIKFMRVKFFEIGPDGSEVSPRQVSYSAMTNPEMSAFNVHDENTIGPFLAQHMPTRYDSAQGYSAPQGTPAYNQKTVIREIQLPQDSFIREVALTPASPYLWGADLQKNRLYRVDPRNPADQKGYPVPLDGPSAPHTVNDDAHGYIWEAGIEGDHIARFDPRTETWRVYTGFGPGSAAHDMALNHQFQVAPDASGRVWVTLIGKNRLGAVHVDSGAVQEFDAPLAPDNSPFRAAIYGLVMDSQKRVWYSQLTGGVGAFDTHTEQFGAFIPYEAGTGPRRMAIDEQDRLYVPLFGSGQLSIVDTASAQEIERVDLPDRNAAPYSAVWDPWRKVVWLGNSNSDSIYRYDPQAKAFAEIPLPRQMAYLRMITFDRRTGNLWTSYSNIPTGQGPSMFVEVALGDGVVPPEPRLRQAGR
jgi:streptogramin lyase